MNSHHRLRIPAWIKYRIPSGPGYRQIFDLLQRQQLATVCQEARCPNITECWNKKSATFMILGKTCTRACRFCSVRHAARGEPLDPAEPQRVAQAVRELGLRYVIITSVDRDDLSDQGSGQYADTIQTIKKFNPQTMVEILIPDFAGRSERLKPIISAGPAVIGHNLETVRRLTAGVRDPRSNYDQSLSLLYTIRELSKDPAIKSGFMVGLGETEEEIVETMRDLARVPVDIVTIGQYLQPSRHCLPVRRFYRPEEFDGFYRLGQQLGIPVVISGPMVRSSYRAAEAAGGLIG